MCLSLLNTSVICKTNTCIFDLVTLVTHETKYFKVFPLKRFPTKGRYVRKIHLDKKALEVIYLAICPQRMYYTLLERRLVM